jgi:Cft2 family RNA processing exonuclease
MWHSPPVPSVTFLGAAQTVTGSRHLLRTSSGRGVLIDAHPALPLYTAAEAEAAARRLEGLRYDVPPGRVFLVHGEPAALEAQRARLSARGFRVEVPAAGEEVQL